MFKPKAKPIEVQQEEVEETEEENNEEFENKVEQVKKAINTKFVRPVEPKPQQEEVEETDEPKVTRMEVLDMIDGHVVRIKQLLDMIRD